jgi:hypothetical protein
MELQIMVSKNIKSVLLVFTIILFPLVLSGQTSKQDSIWRPFKFFIGNWEGNGKSGSGEGKYERSYQFIFNKRFIEVKNKSTYAPQEKNLKGEVHEDLGYISYDKIRKTFVLRQFHIEGFVNQYKLDSISPDKRTIIFLSENIENIPSGWKAKESYSLVNENEFIETFELAEPNSVFEVYSKVKLTKVLK